MRVLIPQLTIAKNEKFRRQGYWYTKGFMSTTESALNYRQPLSVPALIVAVMPFVSVALMGIGYYAVDGARQWLDANKANIAIIWGIYVAQVVITAIFIEVKTKRK